MNLKRTKWTSASRVSKEARGMQEALKEMWTLFEKLI